MVQQVYGARWLAQVQGMGHSVQRQLPEHLLINRLPQRHPPPFGRKEPNTDRERVRKNYCSWLFMTFPDFGAVKNASFPSATEESHDTEVAGMWSGNQSTGICRSLTVYSSVQTGCEKTCHVADTLVLGKQT